MDVIRLPRDTNSNAVPVPDLDYGARILLEAGDDRPTPSAELGRGLYFVQSYGPTVWMSVSSSADDDLYMLHAGNDGVTFFTPGTAVRFTADPLRFGAGLTTIVLIPLREA